MVNHLSALPALNVAIAGSEARPSTKGLRSDLAEEDVKEEEGNNGWGLR